MPLRIRHKSYYFCVCVCVLVTQSCLTLCDPVDCSPPSSSVHGTLQTIILEGVACPPPAHLPDPGIKPGSPALQADSFPSEPPGKPSLNVLACKTPLLPYGTPSQSCGFLLQTLTGWGPRNTGREACPGHAPWSPRPRPLGLLTPPPAPDQLLGWAWASRVLHQLHVTSPLLPAPGPYLV